MATTNPTDKSSEKSISAGLTFEQIKELMSVMRKEGVSEFRMGSGENKIAIFRECEIFEASPMSNASHMQYDGCRSDFGNYRDAEPSDKPILSTGHPVTSPVVGVYYDSPAPDQDPYVAVGDYVQKGDVLCIVEAMKLMNEVTSPVSGIVTEILATRANRVEFGQALFIIEPGVIKE
ncbi:MAG TPA: acetyl-CoA carboxylase biotin carboxyl carrier protein [Clostridiaceae bacterium]|jgi:acetyl-CoA carboxylase biotin carboxyl carrier protein|nr:acetyl-CoA carboxylase biotin carboxyl carrier protein [Clostridiaceae bacterium]